MNVKWNRIFFVLVPLCLLATGAARAGDKEVLVQSTDKEFLDRSIDFKVTAADSGEVFKTFGQILSAQVTFDPELGGRKVTLQLEKARVRTALGALCDNLGCEWTFVGGKPSKLTFKAASGRAAAEAPEAGGEQWLDEKIDITVTAANAVEVLRSAGQILSVEASIDPKIAGTVDFADKGVSVREVLDRICAQVGCSWKLVRGAKTVLTVTSTK